MVNIIALEYLKNLTDLSTGKPMWGGGCFHSARPLGQAVCRHRTVTPNLVLVNPESFIEASRSAGALSLDL